MNCWMSLKFCFVLRKTGAKITWLVRKNKWNTVPKCLAQFLHVKDGQTKVPSPSFLKCASNQAVWYTPIDRWPIRARIKDPVSKAMVLNYSHTNKWLGCFYFLMSESKLHSQSFWFNCSGMKPEKQFFPPKAAQVILICKGVKSTGQEENSSVLLCFDQPVHDVIFHPSAFSLREKKQMVQTTCMGKGVKLCHKAKSSRVGVIGLTNWR